MLDLDRALLLAGAACRAGPDLALGEGGRDELGKVVPLLRDKRIAAGEQGLLQIEHDHLGRKGLVAGVGRAGVLAAAALHAGEGVEVVLPGEVRRLLDAEDLGFLEVERGQLAARGRTAEEDVERAGEHVQVLGVGDVGDEAVDRDDVGPPGDLEVRGDGFGAEARPSDQAGQPGAEEGPAGRFGVMSDGEGLEIKIGRRGQGDQKVDDRGVPGRRRVGLGTDDETAEGQEDDAGHDRERGDVDGEGEDEAEARAAEEEEAVDEALERVADGHRVEGQRAVEDADVHQPGEEPLAAEGAALEEDFNHGVPEAHPEVPEPVLGGTGQNDPDPADDRAEKGRRRGQDEHDKDDFSGVVSMPGLLVCAAALFLQIRPGLSNDGL